MFTGMFQYLGSRGAQHDPDSPLPPSGGVSILGLARSPTKFVRRALRFQPCFNTWAREEPNIAGIDYLVNLSMFQYLGSRGAQPSASSSSYSSQSGFQYLGSRGAQLALLSISFLCHVSILGLARSPTLSGAGPRIQGCVSILGLARSPTLLI